VINESSLLLEFMDTAPNDIVGLIKSMGVAYEEKSMEFGYDGKIEYDGDRFKITVNSDQSQQRRKFTAAHELAHYLLHRDLLMEKGHLDRLFEPSSTPLVGSAITPRHEIEANKFAAQMLMPKKAILDTMVWCHYDLEEIARRFGVSPAAMSIRLKVLGIDLAQERVKETSGEIAKLALTRVSDD
jgi:Zn-dependent peptidase ImmA (M78 family)